MPRSDTHTDLVVVGSGIAGLFAALLASAHCRVTLITKGELEESNTRYAQGGIAAALGPDDSPELHLRDTVAAGDGLCEPAAVATLARAAPRRILDLLSLGVPFDRDGDNLARTLEAAHSRPRVFHAGGDASGARIETTLASAVRDAGVTINEHTLGTRLLTDRSGVRGIETLDSDGGISRIHASRVLLATGGAGQLYARTTNPAVATGDGLALAFRAGAELIDLEFMQFHPTAFALDGAPSFLISEAVRGEGGILRDVTGRAFMTGYHQDGELAPRDVVARAIHQQMLATGGPVTLDITHLDPSRVEHRFPSILAFCRSWGIDPIAHPVPVSPAAHYLMGGVRTDLSGRTTIPGLFAAGEVACTGVHGANRLASNSLLEGLVFADRAVRCISEGHEPESDGESENLVPLDVEDVPLVPSARQIMRESMWRDAGLVRSADSLAAARSTIALLDRAPDERPSREREETRNLALLSRLTVAAALSREESRGAHFRRDFPDHDSSWRCHLALSGRGLRVLPLAPSRSIGAVVGG